LIAIDLELTEQLAVDGEFGRALIVAEVEDWGDCTFEKDPRRPCNYLCYEDFTQKIPAILKNKEFWRWGVTSSSYLSVPKMVQPQGQKKSAHCSPTEHAGRESSFGPGR